MRLIWVVITFIASFILGTSVVAQQMEHQVKRGETFASIAAKYGITEVALRKANANKKTAFAGTVLKIPVSKTTSKNVTAETSEPSHSSIVQSSHPMAVYSGNSISLSNFNKGKEYFYNKKWKKAIKAFNDVLADPQADENTKQQSQQFLAQAQKQQQERKERREALWGGISAGLTALGNTLTETSNALQEQEKRKRDDAYRQSQNNMSNQTMMSQQSMDNYNNGNYHSGNTGLQRNQEVSNYSGSTVHKEKRQPTKTCSWCNLKSRNITINRASNAY